MAAGTGLSMVESRWPLISAVLSIKSPFDFRSKWRKSRWDAVSTRALRDLWV